MRDYINSLIDRHMDGVSQIKPRLPSMFEPEASTGGLEIAVQDDIAPEIEETVSRAPRVSTKKTGPPDTEATQPASSAPVTHSSTFPLVAEPTQPIAAPMVGRHQEKRSAAVLVNEKPKPTAPIGKEDLGRKMRPATEKEAASDMRPTPAAFSLSEERKIPQLKAELQRTQETEGEVTPLSARRRQGQDLNNGVVLAQQEEPREYAEATPEENAEIRPTVIPSAILIAPVVPSVITRERPIAQPQPVINVTIGRIEVRATTSPQKRTPKPESRVPVMSLEEYLRQRSGGRDR